MTEKQAWLVLAKAWNKAIFINTRGASMATMPNGFRCDGLCRCIEMISVTNEIRRRMLAKIKAIPEDLGSPFIYKFPLTRDGAKKRADFCRAQAEKLSKKPGKKRKLRTAT